MNGAYWHLITNHIPVVGMPFSLVLLGAGVAKGSRDLLRAGLIAIAVTALLTIVVDQTGDAAARVMRSYPEVARADIHRHAEAADLAYAATEIAGGLALIALWLSRRKDPNRAVAAIVLVGALVSSLWLGWVAHLGGLIRHTEIRTGLIPPTPESH